MPNSAIPSIPSSSARTYAAPGQNRLLALLSEADREALLAVARRRYYEQRETMVYANQPLPAVIFPTGCIASALTVMEDGDAIETNTVGNEGVIGLQVLFEVDTVPGETICQVPGEGLTIPTATFRALLAERPALRSALLRFAQHVLIMSSQLVACNRLHVIEQRYARWILMTHDRVGHDQFPLTQEFLAVMLGVRRASVSTTASQFQAEGIVRYQRGVVTVVDRARLEAAACECYRVTRSEYDRLLPARGFALGH